MRDELLALDGSNPILYITRVFKLLFTLRGSNSLDNAVFDLKLLSLLGSIFQSESTAKAFSHFIKYGASTAWILQVQLGLSESRTYSSIRTLQALGFIEEIRKFRGMDRVRGGPRPKMWGLTDCSQEQVMTAILLHGKCKSPKYRQAEEVIQSILDEYVIPMGVTEMTWQQLIQRVRGFGKSYRADDIALIGIPILKKHGVKVWR
jgi:hypothetical protein